MKINEIRFRIFWKASSILGKMTVILATCNFNKQKTKGDKQLRIAFFPYSSNDCRTLHEIFARRLNCIFQFTVELKRIDVHGKVNVIEKTQAQNYEGKINGLKKIGLEHEIWRGMADDYRRRCSAEEFFEIDTYNSDVIGKISYSYKKALEIIDQYDVFFLPDLAYTFNRTLHFYAKQQNKKVFILNPHGQLLNVSSPERYPSQTKTIAEIWNEYEQLMEKTKEVLLKMSREYFSDRREGKLKSDREAIKAYNPMNRSKSTETKNVLMLHCIRDASRELPTKIDNFILESDDYFIWTKKMFQEISRVQGSWKIKIHPSSKQYPDEIEIIHRLAKMCGIKTMCFTDVPSTAQILTQRIPVFTYSGTIALETAAAGFRSFVFGSTYPDWMTRRVSFENFSDYFDPDVEMLSSEETETALVILFLNAKHNRPIYKLCPQLSVGPSTDKLARSRSEFKSSRSFFINFLNKDRRSELSFIIDNLSRDLLLNQPTTINFSKYLQEQLMD